MEVGKKCQHHVMERMGGGGGRGELILYLPPPPKGANCINLEYAGSAPLMSHFSHARRESERKRDFYFVDSYGRFFCGY